MNDYSFEKSQIIIWMCLFKVSDSLEDVYYGEYQKKVVWILHQRQ